MSEHLVFLAGRMCDARIFAPQEAYFSTKHSVQILELAGHENFSAIARDLLGQIDAETFALAGFSMGGIAAMECVKQAPDRISRLALINTNHVPFHASRKRMLAQQIAQIEAGEMMLLIEEIIPLYTAKPDKTIADLCRAMAKDLGETVFIQQIRALMTNIGHAEILRGYTKPALVLCGEKDTLCPPSVHQEMAQLLQRASLRVLEEVGHFTLLEAPDQVNHALQEWIDE